MVDDAEPSTSSAEPAASGSNDGHETPSGLKDSSDPPGRPREDKTVGDDEQEAKEVPKKSSSLRFRMKPKKDKQRHSKGVWLVWRLCL